MVLPQFAAFSPVQVSEKKSKSSDITSTTKEFRQCQIYTNLRR